MGRAGLIGMTELEEVQALLERVLPDPSGFTQRLLMQAMALWGQSASPGASAFHPGGDGFGTAGAAQQTGTSATVITPDQVIVDETPIDTNVLLAAALGACECWGLRRDCRLCGGQGFAGWAQPDPELFDEFVKPAVARLPTIPAGGHQQHGGVKAGADSDDHHPVEGEKA
jgi:hypothetical protein